MVREVTHMLEELQFMLRTSVFYLSNNFYFIL